MSKIKILIVEDESKILMSLKLILSDESDLVECIDTATNGQEGLNHIKDNYYDLILTDINMPIMTGDEMLRLLKKDYPNSCSKVYIYSGYSPNEHNCKELYDRYFEKPALIKEIIKYMRIDFAK